MVSLEVPDIPVLLDQTTREFLSKPYVAVLATISPRGRPQATPIWYLLEDDHILVNTSRGRVKLQNLEANPYATLTVVDPVNVYSWVQIQGRTVQFDQQNGARDIDRLSVRYTGKPYRYPSGARPEDRVTIVIRPLRISGLGRR
jgi:PPOX class probable F420-dependent enzyme